MFSDSGHVTMKSVLSQLSGLLSYYKTRYDLELSVYKLAKGFILYCQLSDTAFLLQN